MFIFNNLFWIILGLGIAIPVTVVVVVNVTIKVKLGDEYEVSLASIFFSYVIALLGWAIFIASM